MNNQVNNELELELTGLSLPSEEWRPIEGYEGLYSISDLGRVYSHRKKRVLAPRKQTGGYLQVGLNKDRKRKQMYVHRLVLATFSPRDDSVSLECNHKNGKKDDNRLLNLEWSTGAENTRHSVYVLGNEPRFPRKAVAQFSRDGIRLGVFRSTMDAERATGVYQSDICKCAKGRRKQAGGYVWKYLSDLSE